MFENLTERIQGAFQAFSSQKKLTEENIQDAVAEIRRALLEADVNYSIARRICNDVQEKALGQNIIRSLKAREAFIKIFYDELVELMGSTQSEVKLTGRPTVVLLAGLQGAGKTTFAAKFAKWMADKKQKRPLLVAADVYRPAAMEQLRILGEQIDVPVYVDLKSKDPIKIAQTALQQAKANDNDVVIVDTAGRLSIDEDMMKEISSLHKKLNPQETLFVVDAMTGQDAVNTAKAFNDVLDYTGVILTKMDGDSRGGAALTVKEVSKKPIKFVGTGEKVEDISPFYPDRMANRILNMGDVVSLVEKIQEQYSEEQMQKIERKMSRNRFDFEMFLMQIRQMKKMGGMKSILSMMPGMGALNNVDTDQDEFKAIEAMILSMTPQERTQPEIINYSRKQRIARGAGVRVDDVNSLMTKHKKMTKMLRKINSSGAMMKNLKNMMKGQGGGGMTMPPM